MYSSDNFLDSINQEEEMQELENIFNMKPFLTKSNNFSVKKSSELNILDSSELSNDSFTYDNPFKDISNHSFLFKKHNPITFGKFNNSFLKINKGNGINFTKIKKNFLLKNKIKIENNSQNINNDLIENENNTMDSSSICDSGLELSLLNTISSCDRYKNSKFNNLGKIEEKENSSWMRDNFKLNRTIEEEINLGEDFWFSHKEDKEMNLTSNDFIDNDKVNFKNLQNHDWTINNKPSNKINLYSLEKSMNNLSNSKNKNSLDLKFLKNFRASKDDSDFYFNSKSKINNNVDHWSKNLYLANKNNDLIKSAPEILNNGERITLPILGCGKSDSIKRISAETVSNLVNLKINRKFLLVDARFDYEYIGGHIDGAINVRSEHVLLNLIKKDKPNILIFYCEFSSERGPSLARRFRNLDRNINEYPYLLFPEIYILKGGYKEFYEGFKEQCVPNNYIQMDDKRFRKQYIENQKRKY